MSRQWLWFHTGHRIIIVLVIVFCAAILYAKLDRIQRDVTDFKKAAPVYILKQGGSK